MFDEFDLFTTEECRLICKTVHELQPFWIHRDQKYKQPFYTLGCASYLDARPDPADYYEKAPKHNLILKNQFAWVYDKLALALEKVLGKKIIYDDSLARPGFHIFLASKIFEKPVGSLHCDLQYELLDWKGKGVSFDQPISITASLKLPTWGGGMTVWELSHEEVQGMSKEETNQCIQTRPHRLIKYHTGKMVVHSGKMFHQIAPMQNVVEGDERITLQGHGVLKGDAYLLYW